MINHEHKFIYTKIRKTGSETIQSVLLNLCKESTEHSGHYHLLDDINDKTKDYFKFTFVRNPWDRLVSSYFFTRSRGDDDGINRDAYRGSDFNEFVRAEGPPYTKDEYRKFFLPTDWCSHSPNLQRILNELHPFENQIDWISDRNGKVLTDFIGKLENLQEDFNIVCDKIGIPKQELPHENKGKHKHYTEYYDDETKQIVAEKYAKDIECFGYKYGE